MSADNLYLDAQGIYIMILISGLKGIIIQLKAVWTVKNLTDQV